MTKRPEVIIVKAPTEIEYHDYITRLIVNGNWVWGMSGPETWPTDRRLYWQYA